MPAPPSGVDLQSRALAAEGVVLAKRGEFETGMEMVKEALSLALENNFTAEAVDAYQRLGTVFETAGDYANAREALTSALDLCQLTDDHGPEAGCVACMAYVLRELGEWPRAVELSRELIAAHEGDGIRTIADGVFGFIRGVRGELGPAAPAAQRRAGVGAAARHLLDAGRLRRLAGAGRGLRQQSGGGARALRLRALALGAERGPPLRGLGPAAVGFVLCPGRPDRARRTRASTA